MKLLIICGVISGVFSIFIHEFGSYAEDINPWNFDD